MFIGKGHLTYDPWIWLKVKYLSSTTSVLKDGRIPIEISSFHSKIYFFKTTKEADSSHQLIGFKVLSSSEISVVSMTSTDMITSMASMTSTASLASKNQNLHALYILSEFPGIRNLSSLNDLNDLSNLNDLDSLISSKNLVSLMFSSILAPKCPILVSQCGMDHQKPTILLIFGNLSVGGCGGHGFYF